MKLHEMHDHPIAWTQLLKLLKAGRKVILVIRRNSGHQVIGAIDDAVTGDTGTTGQKLYKIYYTTNDVFLSNFEIDQVQRAEIRRLPDLRGTNGELCFIAPPKLDPPID